MRVKFVILLVGMMAYGYYLRDFTAKAQLAARNITQSYQYAIDIAARAPEDSTQNISLVPSQSALIGK